MADDKKEKFNALSSKIKEHAATTAANAAEAATDEAKRGLFGLFGNKPNAAANTNNTTATTTNAKPTATTTAAKPTATTSVKPTTATTTAAKPTTTTASVKPTTTAAATNAKPTTAAKATAFTDVPANAYYAEAVAWAVQKGITSGTTETTFTPGNPCHRGHAATFLWRANGSPNPKSAKSPFTDVTDGPFYKAILWAVEQGIMQGKTATTFEPTAPCTRGEVLTYLLRSEGKPNATEEEAVKWANVKKLMTGFAGGASVPCTRADIVTILYRAKK
ncbi:MAG: S-layer homology domain-containing protein [Oscillibacter sp.]|nr:S-layer homology domain-containing protein [Oscillibacter sp.]